MNIAGMLTDISILGVDTQKFLVMKGTMEEFKRLADQGHPSAIQMIDCFVKFHAMYVIVSDSVDMENEL